MTKRVIHVFFSSLFIPLCSALNFTLPNQVVVGSLLNFTWNANSSDFATAITIPFVAVLIKSQSGFHCPKKDVINGLGRNVFQLVQDHATVTKPKALNETSGQLLLRAGSAGTHFLCAYGNITKFVEKDSSIKDDDQRGVDSKKFNLKKFKNVVFMAESEAFVVESPSSPTTPKEGDSECSEHEDGNCNKKSEIPAIVGGIAGGIAVVCILVAVLFYRRFRYQRKLNQFHKEHQLLHQAPPTSILASTLTIPNRHPVYGAAFPRLAGIRSPRSPTMDRSTSHIPLSFDETMQKSYDSPSVGSSLSSYSVPHPYEPVLRAQHGAGIGALSV